MSADKILIIEDEPGIADNIVFALEAEGFVTTVCHTGQEGLEQALSRNFTFIILDIGLPDISGIEVCKQVRIKSTVPLIFLTARSDEIDKILGLELGADDYLTKPFSPKELVARIRAVLRRSSKTPKTNLDVSLPIKIDTERREIYFFGKLLEMSFYEFEILTTLARRPGIVFTRDVIMGRVWENPSMITERTVDAHIKSIRKKLKAIDTRELIVTHRSVGYSLRDSW